jgi:hypothetical protein
MGGSTGEGEAAGEILGQCSRTCDPQRENESEEVTANGAGKISHTDTEWVSPWSRALLKR